MILITFNLFTLVFGFQSIDVLNAIRKSINNSHCKSHQNNTPHVSFDKVCVDFGALDRDQLIQPQVTDYSINM